MTNAPVIAARLRRRCSKNHGHIHLMNGRAKHAQVYPEELCVEVIKGFIDQMRFDGRIRDTAIGYVFAVEEGEREVMFWDNVTGQPLDTRLVMEAREKEMAKFATHGVYHKVPVEECWKKTGKAPLGTSWVDIKVSIGEMYLLQFWAGVCLLRTKNNYQLGAGGRWHV